MSNPTADPLVSELRAQCICGDRASHAGPHRCASCRAADAIESGREAEEALALIPIDWQNQIERLSIRVDILTDRLAEYGEVVEW